MRLCQESELDLIFKALILGADPQYCDKQGSTALHACSGDRLVNSKKFDVIKALLKYGAQPHVRNRRGESCLDRLLRLGIRDEGDTDCVVALLSSMSPTCHCDRTCDELTAMWRTFLNPWLITPDSFRQLTEVMFLSGAFPRSYAVDFYDAIRKWPQSDDNRLSGAKEFLEHFLADGFTLKDLCRLKIREAIRPPLVVNVMSDDLILPNQLKDFILFGCTCREVWIKEGNTDC